VNDSTRVHGATLWELVERRAEATPDRVMAFDAEGNEMTFGELRDGALGAAAALSGMGVGRGSRVSWQLPTSFSAMTLVAALARLGAVQNPILPLYRERELTFIVRQVRPRLLVTRDSWRGVDYRALGDTVLAEVRREGPGFACEQLVVDDALPSAAADLLAPLGPVVADPDAVRWIFYTSGTTGDAKGALHTDRSLLAGPTAVVDCWQVTGDDVYPMIFPFTHVGGVGMLGTQLITGCTCLAVDQFDATTTPQLFSRTGITLLTGATPLAILFLEAQRRRPDVPLLPDVRVVCCGAAPKPPDLHANLRDELGGSGAVSNYGMTEAPSIVLSSVDDGDAALATTEGRPRGGAAIRIVDENGKACPPNVPGEVRLRGPHLCKGYLDASLDTEAFDEEGFFRTGDLGTVDEQGNVRLVGRLKDIIIRKGEKISAKELEDVLFSHPRIGDVAVVGIPDPISGERCCAFVVPRAGGDAPTLDDVVAHCRDAGLARHKWPERLEIVDDFPRNAIGKVLKQALRATVDD
jgi:cyclohexanecarboxylate-CoA ligase